MSFRYGAISNNRCWGPVADLATGEIMKDGTPSANNRAVTDRNPGTHEHISCNPDLVPNFILVPEISNERLV